MWKYRKEKSFPIHIQAFFNGPDMEIVILLFREVPQFPFFHLDWRFCFWSFLAIPVSREKEKREKKKTKQIQMGMNSSLASYSILHLGILYRIYENRIYIYEIHNIYISMNHTYSMKNTY
uniref:Uncharacterized protein n=1 Tax=Thalassia hemprichii TaxID=55496 RepID=A0A4Y1KCI0_9LILI|nr:hypothetical protein [Thalassia hemprichii]YP_009667439.1 hypothetical protein [Thalassia hemprichii]ATP74953.1 hypothetical protein [Thalassia hemprichii]ATP74996.1 hypothetical protein [Thalassia hemprichii]